MFYELHYNCCNFCSYVGLIPVTLMSVGYSILHAAICDRTGPGLESYPPYILCQNNILILYIPCDYCINDEQVPAT